MDRKTRVVIMGLILLLSISEGITKQWNCSAISDPQRDPGSCGMTEATWLCDPENISNQTQYAGIVRMIQQIQTMAGCVCDDCGRNSSFPNTYVKIAVLVIPEIDTREFGSSHDALADFAACVRTTRWTHADHCQDDVTIVMTTNDLKVSSSSGLGAVVEGLSKECVDVIIRSNVDTPRYIDRLFSIVEGIKNSLRGEDYCTELRHSTTMEPAPVTTPSPYPLGLSKNQWILIGSACVATLFIVILCCCCCCKESNSGRPNYTLDNIASKPKQNINVSVVDTRM